MNDTRAVAMILSQHKDNSFLRIASGKYVAVGYHSDTDLISFRIYGDFTEDNGIFYSNQLWKYKNSHVTYYGHGVHRQDWDSEIKVHLKILCDIVGNLLGIGTKKKTQKILTILP